MNAGLPAVAPALKFDLPSSLINRPHRVIFFLGHRRRKKAQQRSVPAVQSLDCGELADPC
jgi:hypothetical protein